MKTLENTQEQRQTLLFSATMASDYDRYISKQSLFGKREPALCGSNLLITEEEIDAVFSRTVKGLAQKFYLIPQSVKEAHLIHLLRTIKLK